MIMELAPLSSIAKVHSGDGAPQDAGAFGDAGLPFVRAGSLPKLLGGTTEAELEKIRPEVAEEYGLTLFPAGTVLFAKSGMSATKGYIYRLRQPAYVVNHLAALVPHDSADSSILARILERFPPTSLIKDAAYPSIRLGEIEEMKVLVPQSAADRRRISEILDRAEVLRAKRRAFFARLDTLTQSIFLNLFGDPVANPRKWPNPRLGGLLAFQQYGPRFYNERYSADGVKIVRITDLDESGSLNFSEMPRLSVSEEDRDKYLLRAGDLIFARTGATVGKVALIMPGDPPCIAGAYFITMRFVEAIEPVYAWAVLKAPSIRAIVARTSRQAAQQNFSGPALRKLPMPVPPLELQRDFARRLAAIERLRSAVSRSLTTLDLLFDCLLNRAFRGEL